MSMDELERVARGLVRAKAAAHDSHPSTGELLQCVPCREGVDALQAYWKTMSPDVILALIDRVRALKASTDALRDALDVCAAERVELTTARDEARAEVARLREADAWQPTETAPRSLVYILTHGPRGHVVARYCSALGWVDDGDMDVHFTHWRPLPEPPMVEREARP